MRPNSWYVREGSDAEAGEEVLSGRLPPRNETFVPTVVLAVSKHTIGLPRSALVTVQPLRELLFCEGGPHWLAGVAHVSRSWVLTLSMASWLRGEAVESHLPGELAIVANHTGQCVGLAVDHVIGFRELHQGELLVPPSFLPEASSRLLFGVTADSLLLVNLERVFAAAALLSEQLRGESLWDTSLGGSESFLR